MKPFERAVINIHPEPGKIAGTFDVTFDCGGDPVVERWDEDGEPKALRTSATLRWALGFVLRQLYFED